MKHKGYNNVISGRDHNYGYNGIEESNELGNNMLEMDLRQYDPAIARWIVQDPVTHHNFSPYQAFDNNPIFWADPSGADSQITNHSDRVTISGEAAGQVFNAMSNGLSYANGDSDNSKGGDDPEKDKWIRADARWFGEHITFRYELLNDEKNIHKITLTGWTSKNAPSPKGAPWQGSKNIIEIIIESNNGNPRIVSSIMTGGLYSRQKCEEGHYHMVPAEKLAVIEITDHL